MTDSIDFKCESCQRYDSSVEYRTEYKMNQCNDCYKKDVLEDFEEDYNNRETLNMLIYEFGMSLRDWSSYRKLYPEAFVEPVFNFACFIFDKHYQTGDIFNPIYW